LEAIFQLQQQAATALTSNAIAALHQPNLQHQQQQLSAAQAIFQLQQQAATRAANGSVLTSKANAALQGIYIYIYLEIHASACINLIFYIYR
jgi:predicted ATPase